MNTNKKRKFDIDDDTEQRRYLTLDFLDEYPFLSKTIQAAIFLKTNPIPINAALINACHNSKPAVFKFLFDFFANVVKRYFDEEFIASTTLNNTVQSDDNLILIICDKNYFPFYKWYEQKFLFEHKLDQDKNLDYKMKEKLTRKWQDDNPKPQFDTSNPSFIDQAFIFTDYMVKYLDNLKMDLSRYGVNFKYTLDYDDGVKYYNMEIIN